jgi:hypothetical protein
MTTENEQIIEEEINIITWDQVRSYRNELLIAAESCYNFDSPENMLTAWQEYKQDLRDLPNKYKDLEDLRLIEWPQRPTNYFQTLTLSRYSPH